MDIDFATQVIIPEWLELAREVEPIFQAPMADDPEFRVFIEGKISKSEALIARDKDNNNSVIGIITFSRKNNQISWFAVFDKYKSKGIGTKLLERTLHELGTDNIIEVITFQEGCLEGTPARKVYEKFGFVDYDLAIKVDGHPRSLMKRFP